MFIKKKVKTKPLLMAIRENSIDKVRVLIIKLNIGAIIVFLSTPLTKKSFDLKERKRALKSIEKCSITKFTRMEPICTCTLYCVARLIINPTPIEPKKKATRIK